MSLDWQVEKTETPLIKLLLTHLIVRQAPKTQMDVYIYLMVGHQLCAAWQNPSSHLSVGHVCYPKIFSSHPIWTGPRSRERKFYKQPTAGCQIYLLWHHKTPRSLRHKSNEHLGHPHQWYVSLSRMPMSVWPSTYMIGCSPSRWCIHIFRHNCSDVVERLICGDGPNYRHQKGLQGHDSPMLSGINPATISERSRV